MTNLKRVTITGADDSTSVPNLVDLSIEFPFVEWGILVSKKQEGSYRFPLREWIDRFAEVTSNYTLQVSTHVCGSWVRQMFTGELDWKELPNCLRVSQRVQINTHAERHVSTLGLVDSLGHYATKQFIFQWDGVNSHLTYAADAYGFDVAALFDLSGGAGTLPEYWPQPTSAFWCGYAGGLGPDNVIEQLCKIDSICPKPFWIDMERRVRTEDDSALDLDAVRRVLVACKQHMETD
jgi:hypothetical protein